MKNRGHGWPPDLTTRARPLPPHSHSRHAGGDPTTTSRRSTPNSQLKGHALTAKHHATGLDPQPSAHTRQLGTRKLCLPLILTLTLILFASPLARQCRRADPGPGAGADEHAFLVGRDLSDGRVPRTVSLQPPDQGQRQPHPVQRDARTRRPSASRPAVWRSHARLRPRLPSPARLTLLP